MFFKASANTDILTMVAFVFLCFCLRGSVHELNCLMCWKVNVQSASESACGISSNRLLHHIVLLRIINEGQWGRSDADVA